MLVLEIHSSNIKEQAEEIIKFTKDNGIFNTLWGMLEHQGKRDEAAFFLDAYINENDAYVENKDGKYDVDLGKLMDDDGFLNKHIVSYDEIFEDDKGPYYLLDQIVDKYDYLGGKYYQEDTDNWYEAVRDCFS